MLIDFSVRNFSSIKEEMTLSAETGERLSRFKKTNTIGEGFSSLLKNLIIVGPNGSGKSNLIAAMRQMRNMVLNDPQKVTSKLNFTPFGLSTATVAKPTSFAIRFNYQEMSYDYRFAYTSEKIVSEQLNILTKNAVKNVFSRQGQEYSNLPASLQQVATSTKKNSLLIFTAQKANDKHAIDVLEWFENDLEFVDDDRQSNVISDKLASLIKDDRVKTEFLRFLHFADINIVDVAVREVPLAPMSDFMTIFSNQIVKNFKSYIDLPASGEDELSHYKESFTTKQLYAVHKQYDDEGNVVGTQEIPLTSESRGTQKVFLIALSIINAQLGGNGRTLIFDEFDDSLHFELSKALVQIFNSVPNKNQFILTTHELQLLNLDLRTDQIYLMDKDYQGRSSLKSVFDFKDSRDTARRDVKYMKRYIEGRFGAMPQVDVDQMLSSLNADDVTKSR
ncbi:AAA family ATPase [Lacticaseibacillus zhaodongensis]|uniref:AAA family ATPase n=1 Tax=Lacticaseibacillus zhaodongensis TaxID=2668065 RepID=UPI0012D2EFC2|nr:ATP-binding protein [Lacticaseibacillus zhaodongensis]